MGLKDHHLKKGIPKKKNQSENITIDAKHNEMVKYFQSLQRSIPEKKKELKHLHDEIEKLNEVEHSDFDMEFILLKDSMDEKIKVLEKEIQDITDKKEEKNYYLQVGTLLVDYYENMENSKNKHNHSSTEDFMLHNNDEISDEEDEEFEDDFDPDDEDDEDEKDIETNNKPSKSVIDFFLTSNDDEAKETEVPVENIIESNEDPQKKEMNFASMKMSDFVKQESKFKKKNILEEYLLKVDPHYIPSIKFETQLFFCPDCNYEMTLVPSDGVQVCEKCGKQENILIESDKPSYKDCNGDSGGTSYSYRRQNHYSEWLSQFQAKETTEIPDEVYEKILIEIKKERITNLESLTTQKIRQYLKKIKCNKYYDHAAYILYQINGVPPPTISKELEEKLKIMFKEIQAPFMEVCPRKVRKNFLNYSYVLHKFVELLGLDEYKKYFPLLKDRQKLHETDMIWKKICEKLNWEFYKSI